MSAWPGMTEVVEPPVVALPDGLTPIEPIPSKNERTREIIEKVADLLISAEGRLNELDAKSGDGDTGRHVQIAVL